MRRCHVAYLAGMEVEVGGVEVVASGKVGHTHAEMAKFVDRSGALLEALELVLGAVLLDRLCAHELGTANPNSMTGQPTKLTLSSGKPGS